MLMMIMDIDNGQRWQCINGASPLITISTLLTFWWRGIIRIWSSLILLPLYLIDGHRTQQLNIFSNKPHSLYLPNKTAPGLQRVQWLLWLHEQEPVPLKANNHHPFCVLIHSLSVCHTDLVANDHSGRGHGRQFHMLLCKQIGIRWLDLTHCTIG